MLLWYLLFAIVFGISVILVGWNPASISPRHEADVEHAGRVIVIPTLHLRDVRKADISSIQRISHLWNSFMTSKTEESLAY